MLAKYFEILRQKAGRAGRDNESQLISNPERPRVLTPSSISLGFPAG